MTLQGSDIDYCFNKLELQPGDGLPAFCVISAGIPGDGRLDLFYITSPG